MNPHDSSSGDGIIKVKWTRSKGDNHNEESLSAIFKSYGTIESVFIGTKGNTAIISYRDGASVSSVMDSKDKLASLHGVRVSLLHGSSTTDTADGDGREAADFVVPPKSMFPAYSTDRFPVVIKSVEQVARSRYVTCISNIVFTSHCALANPS